MPVVRDLIMQYKLRKLKREIMGLELKLATLPKMVDNRKKEAQDRYSEVLREIAAHGRTNAAQLRERLDQSNTELQKLCN